jgi:FixJ family two-component response regulator
MCYDFTNHPNYKALTAEEKTIMEKIIAGDINKNIAKSMNMSEEKLEQKLTLIYANFGLKDGHHKKIGLFAKIIKYLQSGEDE